MKNPEKTYHIFVGYDEREHEPFQVAKHTLESHATVPIVVHKLHHKPLRQLKLFTRPWLIDENGQYICGVDGKPFSTQFSHSRFLVPELWRNLPDPNKSSLTMFVDCDFLWVEDIKNMFEEIQQHKLKTSDKAPVYCVKHNFEPANAIKMDNMEQHTYNMKLWSAMMVFNMDNPENSKLTPEVVNSETGRWLHNFGWVSDKNQIGPIDEGWNFIPDHSEKNTKEIRSIHYTEGGPWFKNYRPCKFGKIWWDSYNDFLKSTLLNCDFDVEKMIDG